MAAERIQKYFVNQKDTVNIQCRRCRKIHTLSLHNRKHFLRIKCLCGQFFYAALEFRKDFRHKTHLQGHVRNCSAPREQAYPCFIADHSDGGLLLEITEEVPIKKDDSIIVSYRPNSNTKREIEKTLDVRHYQAGHSIGGVFRDKCPPQRARKLKTSLALLAKAAV